jgi:hypothetical protein
MGSQAVNEMAVHKPNPLSCHLIFFRIYPEKGFSIFQERLKIFLNVSE